MEAIVTMTTELENQTAVLLEPSEKHTSSFRKDRIPFVVFGVIGVIANLVVILVLSSKQAIRKKIMNMYVINQSVIDMLACFVLLMFAVTLPSDRKSVGLSGEFYCKIWVSAVLLWSLYVASTYNILGMTIERYLKIVHPFWYKSYFTKTFAIIGMLMAWLFSFSFNFALTVPTTVIDDDNICRSMGSWPSEKHAQAAGIITVVVELFIPLTILLLCYGAIMWMLRRNMSGSQSGSDNMAAAGASHQRDKAINAAYKNTIKTLALVAMLYAVCWIGNQVYFFMYNVGYPLCWCGPIYIIETILVNVNSCANPFIYAFTYHDFKERCCEILGMKKKAISSSPSTKLTTISPPAEITGNKGTE